MDPENLFAHFKLQHAMGELWGHWHSAVHTHLFLPLHNANSGAAMKKESL